MQQLTVRLLQQKDHQKWDDYIRRHDSGVFYHLTAWKTCLEESFGFLPVYLMAVSETGEIQGILPLFLMKDFLKRKSLISLPFSNFAGFCVDNPEARKALLTACAKAARTVKADYVELRSLEDKVDDWPFDSGRVNFELDMRSGIEHLWSKSIRSNKRNHIRHARKNGLKAYSGKEYIGDFYSVFAENMRRLGTPPYPLSFFSLLLETFGTDAEILVIKKGGRVIAGMFLITCNRTMSVPWASSIARYNRLGPNDLMYWTALERGCERGIDTFDMGRSPKGSGTFHFKKQWGALPRELDYCYLLLKRKAIPSVEKKFGAAIEVWKKLPVDWTVFIGRKIIKYFPEL